MKYIGWAVICLSSVILSACNSMDDYFYSDGYSQSGVREATIPGRHYNKSGTETTEKTDAQAAKTSAEVTKRVEPGSSTVDVTPKTTTTQQGGPAVPNIAPSVSQ